MKECIKSVTLHHGQDLSDTSAFCESVAERSLAFHRSIPGYEETPLRCLSSLADQLGVSAFYVKDESARFGMNAFKSLGGSWSIARCIAEKAGLDPENLCFDRITSPDVRRKTGELTFVTATDGNHGRGVAWTAAKLGHRAVVYMPKGSSKERLNNILLLGADATITDLNYDDAVRLAAEKAETNGWILVQDTAWEGYTKIPLWIMQGYLTLALETVRQLGEVRPTHVFLQAGVGAMSGSFTGFLSSFYGEEQRPVITIVEPNQADCLYRTAEANDGTLHFVRGDMASIMAGLCCGEPCTIGWDILKDHADHFVSLPDWVAAKGMRILSSPTGTDARVISGESGAAGVGFAAELLQNPSLDELRRKIGIGPDSRILCISTEGDTDREQYRRIVWDGLYPSF